MAARLAGSLHFQRRATARRRRSVYIGVIAVVIIIGIVVGHSIMTNGGNQKANANAVQPQLSYGAKQAVDVNLVAGAVGQYAAANNALPLNLAVSNSSLVLCAATCTPSAYEVGGFNVYQPANIKLISYSPTLAVPSANDMYLVPSAKCAKDGGIGAVNTDSRSMVILFATSSGSTTAPRCVVL